MSRPNYSPDFYERVLPYPKRTLNKVNTMFRIFERLPSHFNKLQKVTNLSPSGLSKRLEEMLKLNIICVEKNVKKPKGKKNISNFYKSLPSQPVNVYMKNPDFERFWLDFFSDKIDAKRRFEWGVLMTLKLTFKIKRRGRGKKWNILGYLRKERVSLLEEWKSLCESVDGD